MPEIYRNAENVIEKKKPEEVILRVIIGRHGPKLSAAGEKNALAKYFGDSVRKGFDAMNVRSGDGLVHISTSPVKRAIDSVNIIERELGTTGHRRKNHITRDENLAVPFQPAVEAKEGRHARDLDIIADMQEAIEPQVKTTVETEYPELDTEAKEAEVRNRIDMAVLLVLFSDHEQEPIQRTFETSYHELADTFATRYLGFSRHLGMLEKRKEAIGSAQPQDEPYLQIDISHSFPITSFLKKYLVFDDGSRAEVMGATEFFERTGGIVRESASLQLPDARIIQQRLAACGRFPVR